MPRSSTKANDRVSKKIDSWYFSTEGEFQIKHRATFDIYLRRNGRVQIKDEGLDPLISFEAVINCQESSGIFSATSSFGALSAKDNSIQDLRKKVQELFEEATASDWRKVILVMMHNSDSHKSKFKLEFDFAVCERGGDLYRRDDGWITRNPHNLCGDFGTETIELPYSEEMVAALQLLHGNLLDFTRKLTLLVSNPVKFLASAKATTLLLG